MMMMREGGRECCVVTVMEGWEEGKGGGRSLEPFVIVCLPP